MISFNPKWVFTLLLIPLVAAAEGPLTRYRIQGDAAYQGVTIENSGSLSYFSGLSSGATVERVASAARYRTSFLIGFQTMKLKNSANSATRTELLNGTSYFLGARFYTEYLFVGARIAAGNKTLSVSVLNTESTIQYIEYGVAAELGTTFHLGTAFVFAPSLNYKKSQLEPKLSSSPTHNASEFSATISMGIEF